MLDALLALIDAEQSRQSIPDAEVQDVIATLEEYAYQNLDDGFEPCQISTGEVIDVVSPILSAYRKPSADQAEQIDRAIEIFQAHIDEAGKIVGHKPDCKYCEASRTGITALNRWKGNK